MTIPAGTSLPPGPASHGERPRSPAANHLPVRRRMGYSGRKLKLGADASIVVINEGVDGELSTNSVRQDIYYYAQTDSGLFAGISIEGSDIFTKDKYNSVFYGGSPTPADITIRQNVQNSGADRLREALP